MKPKSLFLLLGPTLCFLPFDFARLAVLALQTFTSLAFSRSERGEAGVESSQVQVSRCRVTFHSAEPCCIVTSLWRASCFFFAFSMGLLLFNQEAIFYYQMPNAAARPGESQSAIRSTLNLAANWSQMTGKQESDMYSRLRARQESNLIPKLVQRVGKS